MKRTFVDYACIFSRFVRLYFPFQNSIYDKKNSIMVEFCDKLKIASFYLDSSESVVKYSFVVLKSVAYLDLSLCELSSLKGKRANVIHPNYILSPSTIVTSSFVCTEEGCKKSLAKNRTLLYNLHLDVSSKLELRFGNNKTSNDLRYHSDSVLLNKMGVESSWFERRLNRMVTDALQETNQKVKLLHQISKTEQRINFIEKYGYIRRRGADILYSNCRDSNIVNDFLIAMDFGNVHLLKFPQRVVEYLLYHAKCAGYSFRDHLLRDNLIDVALFNRKFKYVATLFRYLDTPRFYESAYAEMKVNLKFVRSDVDWVKISKSENHIGKVRLHRMLQIVYIYNACLKGPCYLVHALEALRLIWSSIPDFFVCLDEMNALWFSDKTISESHNFYEVAINQIVSCREPRLLSQYCRSMIRRSLANNKCWLPDGIKQLNLPPRVESFLNLQSDQLYPENFHPLQQN